MLEKNFLSASSGFDGGVGLRCCWRLWQVEQASYGRGTKGWRQPGRVLPWFHSHGSPREEVLPLVVLDTYVRGHVLEPWGNGSVVEEGLPKWPQKCN